MRIDTDADDPRHLVNALLKHSRFTRAKLRRGVLVLRSTPEAGASFIFSLEPEELQP